MLGPGVWEGEEGEGLNGGGGACEGSVTGRGGGTTVGT